MTPLSIDEVLQRACADHRAGRFSQAETGYREILAREPNQADALHLLGVLASQAGNPEAAIGLIRRAISVHPIAPWFHNNLGNALTDAGRLAQAIEAYWAAIRLDPGIAPFHNHLGNALNRSGRLEEAIAAYRWALEIDPAHAEAHSDLGNALVASGKTEEALAFCRRAVELKPALTEAHRNLGICLAGMGRIDEAIASHRRAVDLEPGNPRAQSDLLFALHYHPEVGPEALLEEHRDWNRRHGAPLRAQLRPHPNEPSPERPLRIGYVSPDFCDHVVGHNLLPLFRRHDRRHFEIFAYSMSVRRDAVFEELKSLADHWRNIVGVRDERAAELIREDRIDILVDLALHTAGNRLPLFVRKPAPVQVTYLGYCGTTGLDAIDYRLSDPYLDPPGSDPSCYSEQTIRLAESYWCYEPFGPAPEVLPGPVQANRYVTFGCLNNFAKVSAAALDLWLEILRAVPGSRLLLLAPVGPARDAVIERFANAGMDRRLDFVGIEPWESYIRNVQRMDIALDPFPYGGGVTTCDALWMGVPVVSLAGKTAVGRGGRSILSNLGLENLVADTPAQYREIAVTLANDLPRLAELRATLRERMEKSPLRDAVGYARNIEQAYRAMWRKWCESRAGAASGPETMREMPKATDAWVDQAIELKSQGKVDEAIEGYRRVLQLDPEHGAAHYNLGLAFQTKGAVDEAIQSYREAVRLMPAFPYAQNNLGNALQSARRWDEAIEHYREAIRLNPDFAESYNNLGTALRNRGEIEEAIAAFERSAAINPVRPEVYVNLGAALQAAGQLKGAIAAYARAEQLNPKDAEAHSRRILLLHHDPDSDAETLYRENVSWDERHGRPLRHFIEPHANDPSPERRLRIGFVSPNFYKHVVGHNLLPLLREHDRDGHEIFCYSNGSRTDSLTEEIRRRSDGWREIVGVSDERAAAMIRDDRIDVLVDLALHTSGNRLLVFARKPAPVQVTWLGYCGTTGLATMDYRLSDRWLDPPGTPTPWYSEETVWLREAYWCYEPSGPCPEVAPPPAIQSGYVTFCCRNEFLKVSPEALDLWMDILAATPYSRLLLSAPLGLPREIVLKRMRAKGIGVERVELISRKQPWEEFMGSYARADIGLDPFPYSGWITTCDALWMGVPVVSLAGRTAVGRGGKSILSCIGLSELVAENRDEYLRIAVELANDLPRSTELRRGLRERMARSPMRDAKTFARDIEAAYRTMWRTWCKRR